MQHSGNAKRTTLSEDPAYMWAILMESERQTALIVYRSPVVDKTWPMYQPVVGFLGEVCSVALSEYTVEDEDMMFGEAVCIEYGIFEACPGESVRHICKVARMERAEQREAS